LLDRKDLPILSQEIPLLLQTDPIGASDGLAFCERPLTFARMMWTEDSMMKA